MTIETQQVDAYVQGMCTDRALSPYARAQSAAAAITNHVVQEAGLLVGTHLPVGEGWEDAEVRIYESRLDAEANISKEESSAYEWMALAYTAQAAKALTPTMIEFGEEAAQIADVLDFAWLSLDDTLPNDEEDQQ